jgi:hypothetical protein
MVPSPRSQVPNTYRIVSQISPVHTPIWRSILISSYHLLLGLPSVLFPQVSHQNPVRVSFPIRATSHAYLMLLDLRQLHLMNVNLPTYIPTHLPTQPSERPSSLMFYKTHHTLCQPELRACIITKVMTVGQTGYSHFRTSGTHIIILYARKRLRFHQETAFKCNYSWSLLLPRSSKRTVLTVQNIQVV